MIKERYLPCQSLIITAILKGLSDKGKIRYEF